MDVNWFPGHMAKTLRDLKEYLKLVDIVVETCDARIPESSRNPELRRLIGQKPHILVLNKADLADPDMTERWVAWYRQRGLNVLACTGTRKSGLSDLANMARAINKPKTDRMAAKGRIFQPVRLLIAGIPNTGKSTLINALAGKKIAQTADKPGVTRHLSWIRSGSDLELLDSPGVLWPKLGTKRHQLNLAATGAIRDDVLPLEEIAAEMLVLLSKIYPELISARYHLDAMDAPAEVLLDQAARKRGCLLPGDRTDTRKFAILFLDELRAGKIGRISLEKPE